MPEANDWFSLMMNGIIQQTGPIRVRLNYCTVLMLFVLEPWRLVAFELVFVTGQPAKAIAEIGD